MIDIKPTYKLSQFEKKVQTEICDLINVPMNSKDIQVVKKEENEKEKRISLYQMKSHIIIITAPSLFKDVVSEVKSLDDDSHISIEHLKNVLNLDHHNIADKTVYLFLNPDTHKKIQHSGVLSIKRLDDSYVDEFKKFTSE